jgi:hypothetical protein
MNSKGDTSPPSKDLPLDVNPSAGSADIDLDRIQRRACGILFVEFSAGEDHWSIELTARQLRTFGAFQVAVADALGLWVWHECQEEERPWYRNETWHFAVATAFGAGASGT